MEEDSLELLGNNLKAHIADNDLANKISTGIDVFGVIVDLAIQLPVIDTFKKLSDSFNNYNALRLHKKLTKFLFGISDIPPLDRQRFMEELDSLHELKEKSGEVLIDIIVRTNHLGKIDFIINLFKAQVAGKIDISEFIRLSVVLEKVSVSDLYQLKNYDLNTQSSKPGIYEGSLTDALYSAGLVDISVIGGNTGTLFNLNNLGRQMLLHALSESQ
ncbi:hypothetical protein [Mucilaginibacter paludis]|uniref:Uncharacterized protein n=1 Tax=Mucilaginibacter paludis DSM 18603 TaxID=714943 RepID=H1YH99_9SPHI|nr:hypothetical protein [Mucilaginibacter paludis]EHQ24601.1 hypothetical protein Mucpa_0407 [Mucilaginibacter paludis DSM 18603]